MKVKGYIFAILSAFLYGLSGVFVKKCASSSFSSTEVLMLQNIISCGILFIYCIFKYRKELKVPKETLKQLILLGAFGNTVTSVAIYGAYSVLDIGTATMLLYLYPSFIAIYFILFLKQGMSKTTIVGIIGTFIGCALILNIGGTISGHGSNLNSKGLMLGLVAAVAYAFINIYAKHVVSKVPAVVITLFSGLLSLMMLSIFNIGFFFKVSSISLGSFVNIFILATVCGMLPTIFLYAALKEIGPIKTSIISTLEIPATALYGFLFFHSRLSIKMILGMILILICVILLKRDEEG